MLAGHYASAFAAKAASTRLPLWVLLLAAQFVDVFWAIFILTGVEHATLDTSLASNPLVLDSMPWTHSLVGSIAWAVLAFVAARKILAVSVRDAALVAAVVVSHWFLDLLVHRPDLTLVGGESKLGMALWDQPLLAFVLEIGLVVASLSVALRACRPTPEAQRRWIKLGAGLVLLQTATMLGPLPTSIQAMAATTLILFFVVAAAGRWAEGPTAP